MARAAAGPREPVAWIRLQRTRVQVPGQGVVQVPFSARVPRGVRSGDHLAGILAYGQSPRPTRRHSRFRLRFVSRLAIAVQVRVPGPRRTVLDFRGASINVVPAGAFLGLKLADTGNTLIPTTSGRLSVFKGSRRLFSSRIRIDSFVPLTGITYPLPWPGRPVEGKYRVVGHLDPKGGRRIRIDETVDFAKKRIREFRRETGRQAVEQHGYSPGFILLLFIIAAALVAVGVALGRARSRQR